MLILVIKFKNARWCQEKECFEPKALAWELRISRCCFAGHSDILISSLYQPV